MTINRPDLSHDEVMDLAPGFVLGSLDDATAEAVRAHLAVCPEEHAELAELGVVVGYLADSVEPVEPPVGLRSRISDAIVNDHLVSTAGRAPVSPLASPPAPEGIAPSTPPIARRSGGFRIGGHRRSPLAWAAAAAVLLIAALGVWNVRLATDLDTSRAYATAVEKALAVASAPGGQAAVLAPSTPGGPSGLAGIGPDGTVSLAMRGLPATGGSKVYTVWVIGPGAAPANVGSFTVGGDGLGALALAQGPPLSGATIALTLEVEAGRSSPAGPIVSKGVARAAAGS